jgi:hypothetical protein
MSSAASSMTTWSHVGVVLYGKRKYLEEASYS